MGASLGPSSCPTPYPTGVVAWGWVLLNCLSAHANTHTYTHHTHTSPGAFLSLQRIAALCLYVGRMALEFLQTSHVDGTDFQRRSGEPLW